MLQIQKLEDGKYTYKVLAHDYGSMSYLLSSVKQLQLAQDKLLPPRAELSGTLITPFEPIPVGSTGLLEVIYQGVTYHGEIKPD